MCQLFSPFGSPRKRREAWIVRESLSLGQTPCDGSHSREARCSNLILLSWNILSLLPLCCRDKISSLFFEVRTWKSYQSVQFRISFCSWKNAEQTEPLVPNLAETQSPSFLASCKHGKIHFTREEFIPIPSRFAFCCKLHTAGHGTKLLKPKFIPGNVDNNARMPDPLWALLINGSKIWIIGSHSSAEGEGAGTKRGLLLGPAWAWAAAYCPAPGLGNG